MKEIILTMDGNAKIGLMGEEITRNGKMLLEVIKNMNVVIINGSEKCKGTITRKNTKKESETSAIDFVIASRTAEQWINEMNIDEDGVMKIKGKNETDHNTISIDINIKNIDRTKKIKRTEWNVNAPTEKWQEYSNELRKRKEEAEMVITNDKIPIDIRLLNCSIT